MAGNPPVAQGNTPTPPPVPPAANPNNPSAPTQAALQSTTPLNAANELSNQSPAIPKPTINPVPPKPMTLTEVLAARKAAINGQAIPHSQVQIQTPPQASQPPQNEPPAPQPEPQQQQLTPEQAMYQLYQQDPQKLMQILQAANGEQANAPAQKPAENQPLAPQDFRQQRFQEAQQQYSQRPLITAEGLFGADALQEMGIPNTDFTPQLEQFVYSTLAPVFATLLSDVYAANHGFDQRLQQYQPALQAYQQTDLQKSLGKQLHEAFPALAQGDTNAVKHAEQMFNEMAPMLMSKELMDNPASNPEEYARITTGIAKIAASRYAALPPAPTGNPAPVAQLPANVSPEPQPVAPTYRNHMGQFAAKQVPRTLDAYNQQRLEVMFPKR